MSTDFVTHSNWSRSDYQLTETTSGFHCNVGVSLKLRLYPVISCMFFWATQESTHRDFKTTQMNVHRAPRHLTKLKFFRALNATYLAKRTIYSPWSRATSPSIHLIPKTSGRADARWQWCSNNNHSSATSACCYTASGKRVVVRVAGVFGPFTLIVTLSR